MCSDATEGDEMSTCVDSVRWVSQLRDGELDDGDVVRLERHLKRCIRCQIARKQFESVFTGLDDVLARKNSGGTV